MAQTRNLPETFFATAVLRGPERAFYYCRQRDRKWVEMTWRRYRAELINLASWLQEQGIKKGDRVAILSGNRPEWIISDLAIMTLGAITVPIYATASKSDSSYILQHSDAKILLVDSLENIDFLTEYKFSHILAYDRAGKNVTDSFASPVTFYSEMLRQRLATVTEPVKLDDDDVATIIYTSGTTGRPKGVIHTHGNIKATLPVIAEYLGGKEDRKDSFLSFLPLSHVAERALVVFGSIVTGSDVAFARSIDTLGEDLVRCRPTILLCVPRLWEKIYERIQASLITASPLKRTLFQLAQGLGEQSRIDDDKILGAKEQLPILSFLSDKLVGEKLKAKLGLDRCRLFLTGAAPTRPEIMKFFGSFGIVIREVYGLTENLCLGVVNDPDVSVIGSCGKAFSGNLVKIADDGEILFKAPWNFKGYYKNPEASAEALTDDGWLRTGDLGEIDEEQRLWIKGRKKELLKTSGGKYIAPVPIEDRLKAWSAIKDAMVVGDTRKYCVALVSLNDEMLEKTKSQGLTKEIKTFLREINEPLASFETIKRVGVLKESFSVEKGTLTPTLKVKRIVVAKEHEAFIDRLYSSEEVVIYQT